MDLTLKLELGKVLGDISGIENLTFRKSFLRIVIYFYCN